MTREEEPVMCQHLLVAADRYHMDRLKLMCEERLHRSIDVGSVADILALAEQHGCHGLRKTCIKFLESPDALDAVLTTDDLEQPSSPSCKQGGQDPASQHPMFLDYLTAMSHT
ncbi:hypothetical protein PR202_gb08084 [Eleusine coracana subsp. coracana]|uniref:BPM/SPOP BACK domain-containing protein n=1 Tax=Eleusine coracana subsp. coracana TaxID=191504 RepID=A0AAV5EDS3_ELECO|nr:hypothetical protein PR202_gb08084 [Eleusine coracana subsp. coracana]